MARFDEIKLAGQLPSPKGVALAIMNLCGREDCTIEDVARLVQTDPALSGRLLRLANSSGGTHRPVSAINEALLRIGMKAVAQLTMGFSLVDQFKDGPCKGFDYRNFWSRSLLMALASRELGRHRVRLDHHLEWMLGRDEEWIAASIFSFFPACGSARAG